MVEAPDPPADEAHERPEGGAGEIRALPRTMTVRGMAAMSPSPGPVPPSRSAAGVATGQDHHPLLRHRNGNGGMRRNPRCSLPAAATGAARWEIEHNARVRRRLGLVGLGGALAVAASFTTPFTTGAEIATALAIGVFLAAELAAARCGPRAPREAPPPWRAGAAWGALAGTVLAFELWNYFRGPRSAHPTLSYFVSAAAGQPWSRGLLFAAWLALGGWLVSR